MLPSDMTEKKELVNEIETYYDKVKNSRLFYEKEWVVNLAYLLGKQWTRYNNATQRLYEPGAPSWRVRLTSNLILPVFRILKAKILRIEPMLHVLPSTNDKEAKASAKVADKVLSFLWRTLRMVMVMDSLVGEVLSSGTAFLKPFFNKNVGKKFTEFDTTTTPNENPYLDEDGRQKVDEKNVPLFLVLDANGQPIVKEYCTGEIEVDVVSPFEIFPDPLATSMEDCKWVMQAKVRSVIQIQELYGITVEPEDKLILYGTGVSEQIQQLLGKEEETQDTDGALVKEYWEVPTKKFPKGRVITVANGELLQNEEIPDEYLELKNPLPFIKFDFIKIPKRFFSKSLIDDLRPLQKEYNKSRSQVIENKNLTAKGKLLIAIQSKVSKNAFTSEPGEKIYHYAGNWAPPTMLSITPLPNYVFQNLADIKQDMFDISGVHEVSQARTPKGIRSGAAISILQEQDDTQLGPVIHGFQDSLETFGRMLLEIVKKRYTEPRAIKVVGKDMVDFVNDFIGNDILGCDDVVVQMGSSIPQNKIAREQYLTQLYTLGLLSKEEVREYLGLEGEEVFSDDRLDEAKAVIENEQMAKGIVMKVDTFDDHLAHIKILNAFRKQEIYYDFDDRIKHIFMMHEKTHEDLLQGLELDGEGGMTLDIKLKLAKELPPTPPSTGQSAPPMGAPPPIGA